MPTRARKGPLPRRHRRPAESPPFPCNRKRSASAGLALPSRPLRCRRAWNREASRPFCRDGRALPFLGAVDAAGSRHNAGIVVLDRRADIFELARIKLDPLPTCKLVQDQSADPVSQGQAVGLGLPVKIVSADEKTRPRHVFHDKGWVAGKMLPHVAGEHTRIGVKSAPRCSRHDQANRLTLVKILCRYHAGPTSRDKQYKRREHARKKFLLHVVTSFFPNTAKIDIGDAGQHSTYFALTQASFSSTLCVIKSRCSTSEYRASR